MTILKIPSFILLVVTGCGLTTVSGQVSTAWYQSPPSQLAFTVMSSDQLSLTNRQISGLIEKLIERGYSKVNSLEDANVAVVYEFAVGTGSSKISSIPNYATGGQLTQSTTIYPRSFKVMIIDVKRSQLPRRSS